MSIYVDATYPRLMHTTDATPLSGDTGLGTSKARKEEDRGDGRREGKCERARGRERERERKRKREREREREKFIDNQIDD